MASKLSDEYMDLRECAKRMNKGYGWLRTQLQIDSRRACPTYPFAKATQDKATGRWSYRIHRQRFEAWCQGADIDNEALATKGPQPGIPMLGEKYKIALR